ncbi:hypothetical protein vseg_017118 [Gypsophila vaccaria]
MRNHLPPHDSPSPGGSCGGAPVMLLVLIHKAFRRELTELRGFLGGGVAAAVAVEEVRSRLEFFRSVYRRHCVAEAEVLLSALDERVENIAGTYYLQHHSTHAMFESAFSCLNDQERPSQDLQQLVTDIGTLWDSICQHMAKEEKQVFPLLKTHFSDEEQASLIWQFMCSFPVNLLEDMFPWLANLLSQEEQLDLKDCISNILRRDKLTLHETVKFWIDKGAKNSQAIGDNNGSSSECPQEQDYQRDMSTVCLLKNGPFECLLLWHAAIKADLEEVVNKLAQARRQKFPNLSQVIIQIKFLNEVLISYSDILEKIFYPLLDESSSHQPSSSYKSFPHKNDVVGLQKILYDADKICEPTFLESLCSQTESLVVGIAEYLSFQETEIVPLISAKCNHESQLEILIRSLRSLPLGLLKCVATWFSSHLLKGELKVILQGIGQSCILDKPFASLLHEWFHAGYSGKSSNEILEEISSRRVPFMSELIRDYNDPCKNLEQESLSDAGSSRTLLTHSMSKSGDTNLVVLSPRTKNLASSFYGSPIEAVSYNFLEPRPMDHIYYFHRAIKKDLESLVLDAVKLSKDSERLTEFTQHFCFVRSLYELHSETEDHIAFPALEANISARNITQSYSMDHEMEAQYFEKVSGILDEMSGLYDTVSRADVDLVDPAFVKYHQLCLELEDSCKSLKKILEDHILREETELWPLFREYFSIEEQEKILGFMLGRTRAEILQKMIVWLMAHLSSDEQQAMMNYWRKATYSTKFNEWLGEWWDNVSKYDIHEADSSAMCSSAADSENTVSKYQSRGVFREPREHFSMDFLNEDYKSAKMAKKMEGLDVVNHRRGSLNFNLNQLSKPAIEMHQPNKPLVVSQAEKEATNTTLSKDFFPADSKVIQSSTSLCLAAKSHTDSGDVISNESGKLQGQFPSYRDIVGSVFGCKHYKQNCKLFASCCNKIFTCRRCHDDEINDHVMDRKSITHMMCMRCLEIQPIGQICTTPSCKGYTMARYYCSICKLFEDERIIYHCPFCNLCRLGKGLGIDYYHCMKCNACMSRYRPSHICIEKSIEDKCPICLEDLFTSTNIIKSLQCGHVMHSTCFQDYTCLHYSCPICSKSLGNMQVYFDMLDAFLAEEEMPEEYRGKTQGILCNDCEKKGTARFHWLYHKCSSCGSYNTRLL